MVKKTVTNIEFQTVKKVLDQLIMMILLDHEGQIVNVNEYFCKITKYSLEEVLGQNYKMFNSGFHTENFYQEVVEMISEGQKWTGEISIRCKNGELIWVKSDITPIVEKLGEPSQYLIFLIDITESQNAEKWKYMAFHDELTGLSNRRMLNFAFDSAILLANEQKTKFAVFIMDINHFKYINDSFGHLIGDKLLKEIGFRLKALFSNEDCVFRFGGDEFVILLDEIEKLEEVAQEIIDLFKKPFVIDSHRFHASTKIGISIYPDHSIYQDNLMKFADIAMLSSRRRSKSYQIYHYSLENIK